MKQRSQHKKPYLLSSETIAAMEELGLALKAIYLRLKSEGYQFVDGKFIKPKGHEQNQDQKI